MTGISSHVFKRLVIVIFQSGSLTLAGWTTTYNRVGEFKRDGLLHMTGISSHVFKRLDCPISSRMDHHNSEYNRVGEFKRDGLLHDSV